MVSENIEIIWEWLFCNQEPYPVHGLPPHWGGMHVLTRSSTPEPHSAEQLDHFKIGDFSKNDWNEFWQNSNSSTYSIILFLE